MIEKHIVMNHELLQPHTNYTVDVQATFCPGWPYQGPWSEWSSPAGWRTGDIEGSLDDKGSLDLIEFPFKRAVTAADEGVCVHVLRVRNRKVSDLMFGVCRSVVAGLSACHHLHHPRAVPVLLTENVSTLKLYYPR